MAMYKHTNMYTLYTYADLRDACVQTYMHAHRERYTYDSCTHTHVHISTFIYKHRHAHMHPCTFVQLECTRHDVYYAGACTCTHICSSVHVWKLYDWIRHDKQEISLLVELQVSTVSWEYKISSILSVSGVIITSWDLKKIQKKTLKKLLSR